MELCSGAPARAEGGQMRNLRFTWDQQGRVTAVGEPPRDVLADYLSNELQANPSACRRLLNTLRQLRTGKRDAWEVLGEAWTLKLSRFSAELISEDVVPGRRMALPIEDLEEAVDSWLQFIEFARV